MSLTEAGIRAPVWRRARRSMANGDCVEVAPAGSRILVRDSKDQNGTVMQFPGGAWRTFLMDAKKGQFDLDCL